MKNNNERSIKLFIIPHIYTKCSEQIHVTVALHGYAQRNTEQQQQQHQQNDRKRRRRRKKTAHQPSDKLSFVCFVDIFRCSKQFYLVRAFVWCDRCIKLCVNAKRNIYIYPWMMVMMFMFPLSNSLHWLVHSMQCRPLNANERIECLMEIMILAIERRRIPSTNQHTVDFIYFSYLQLENS